MLKEPKTYPASVEIFIDVRSYDLAMTLNSGQAFRWQFLNGAWEGIIGLHWVQLKPEAKGIRARTSSPVTSWHWLRNYLQTGVDLQAVLTSFPDDAPMKKSAAACRGLRLLRQEPWECLASFIASSTKQIVQIRQIVALLCERFGKPVTVPSGHAPVFAFPPSQRIAQCTETELRACKLGFRAPYLLAAARQVSSHEIDLESLGEKTLAAARAELLRIPGVGEKIANCVLLFACGFHEAFPVDVWIDRALRELYFPKQRVSRAKIAQFAASHFGPNAGYAQQYLFHFMRKKNRESPREDRGVILGAGS